MAITYDGNKITVSGGTAGTPLTFDDIYNEDVANSWGVVSKIGENEFFIDTNVLVTGSGTYLKTTKEHIRIGSTANKKVFNVRLGATFTMGKLDAEGFGIEGSALYLTGNWSVNKTEIGISESYNYQKGLWEVYGSFIEVDPAGFSNMAFYGTVDFVDVIYRSNGQYYMTAQCSGSIKRMTIDVNTLFYIYTVNVTLDNVIFIGQTVGVLSGGSSVLRNIDFGTKVLRRYYGAQINLYDCLIPNNQVTSHGSGLTNHVYKWFTHSAKITFNNNPETGVSLRLADSATNLERYNNATDGTGENPSTEVLAWDLEFISSTPNFQDYESKELRVRKFGFQFISLPFPLNKKTKVELLLNSDTKLTETVKATVDAYTELETMYKAYDYSRSWLSLSSSMQFVDPIQLEGDKMISSFDIVIDATASNVFDFDGTTVTIKASVFASNIKTTGTVTAINGATITGAIQDATADSVVNVTVPSGYDNYIGVYANKADAENNTNVLATGASFRYLAGVYGGQQMWYRMEQLDTSYIIENYTIPVPVGVYNVNLVVTGENSALGQILTIVKEIDTMTEMSGANKVYKTTALQNAPSGNGDGAAVIAGAVWDKAKASHNTPGTFGENAQKVKNDTDLIIGLSA